MNLDLTSFFTGLASGLVSSVIFAWGYDRFTQPALQMTVGGRAPWGTEGKSAEFFHVAVQNKRDGDDGVLPTRRPAWACTATLEILSRDGTQRILPPISARWTSQPEPLLTVMSSSGLVNTIDWARVIAGRKVDIHTHVVQELSVLLKFEGQDECFLFTNESYQFDDWASPDWRLGLGRHRLRVTVWSESGRSTADFWIENLGKRTADLELVPFESRSIV